MGGAGGQGDPKNFGWRLLGGTEASSLVEFAICLPLLVVLVVGIFDFGGAFNQKQMLNNAMREGARFGASLPTNDLCTSCGAPPSVDAVRYFVDAYLLAAKLNDCGLSIPSVSGSGPPWAYTANTGCAGTLTLTIDRGYASSATSVSCPPLTETIGANTPVNLFCTKVTISYPYQWHFDNVIQLVSPGASYALTNITTNATAVNMD